MEAQKYIWYIGKVKLEGRKMYFENLLTALNLSLLILLLNTYL